MKAWNNIIILASAAGLAGFMPHQPAVAQVASVTVFGPMNDPIVQDQNGVVARRSADFALYSFNRSQAAASAGTAQSGQVSPVFATMRSRAPLLSTTSDIAPVSGSECAAIASAPPRLLAHQVAHARNVFWPTIAAAECRFGLPAGLMDSVVLAESRYDASSVSPAGAAGLTQLMPDTARQLGVLDRMDPVANIIGGARYLRSLIDDFAGNIPLALAAYNAGPAAVRRDGRIPFNHETPGYVQRVLGYWTAPGIGPLSTAISARQTARLLGLGPRPTR